MSTQINELVNRVLKRSDLESFIPYAPTRIAIYRALCDEFETLFFSHHISKDQFDNMSVNQAKGYSRSMASKMLADKLLDGGFLEEHEFKGDFEMINSYTIIVQKGKK